MPFAAVERPSLALGLFAASLKEARVSAEALYPNIGFAERIGLPAYVLIRSSSPSVLLGEWVFGESAFGEAARARGGLGQASHHFEVPDEFVDLVLQYRRQADLASLLRGLRATASEFVAELAAEIAGGRPKVVACTSMFDQHVASLALLQRVKALDPDILTVIGGANCAGRMGLATHRSFPAVDFTVTGEFDQYAADFFRSLVAAEGDAARVGPLPPNVLGPESRQDQTDVLPPAAILTDMDRASVPDFDDYFEQLYSSPISRYVRPSIPLETSRGCWWGAKQHCTFCGLNAEGMAFRKKSSARALEEIRSLTSKYGVLRFAATDNIIDMSYFRTVLPELAGDGRSYNFFYETKANLKREDVQAMAEAGCNFIQPGLESLHDETLKIMKKGTTACANIQLLKHCVEFGVTPSWSILCGFPGSDPEWVAEIAADLPALFHLPPPEGTTRIRFDRFSPYHQRPGEFGLQLEPLPSYALVYPFADAVLEDLAYFFRQRGGVAPRVVETVRLAREVTARWRAEFWSRRRAELVIEADDGNALRIRDTRDGPAAVLHELSGLSAAVMRALEAPATGPALRARVRASGWSAAGEGEVDAEVAHLRERRLVWRSSSQLVALATPPPKRPMPDLSDTAVGRVDMAKYLVEQARSRLAFAV
jgi:magnesium-protoporphyrin IX monomethyl ester (oxidative) cyclase